MFWCTFEHLIVAGFSSHNTKMRRQKIPASERAFIEHIRELEQKQFPDQLHDDRSMMKSEERRFWHFRPSHHFATGLLTQEDVALLSRPNTHLLSVGAFPCFLERILLELGIPAHNIVIADKDPAILQCSKQMKAVTFDATDAWPEMGMFDRIIFPESLCTCLGDTMREKNLISDDVRKRDAVEAELLTGLMRQALYRLHPGGILRANGPMSHPNVVRMMEESLQKDGYRHSLGYQRFFLYIRKEL